MTDNPDTSEETIDYGRRTLLASLGGAVSIGLAGCGGDGDGNGGDGDGNGGDGNGNGGDSTPTETITPTETFTPRKTQEDISEAVDPTMDRNFGTVPTDLNMRPLNPNPLRIWITSVPAGNRGLNSEGPKDELNPVDFPGMIAETGFADNGQTFTVKYAEDYTWTNGDPVTAQDAYNWAEFKRIVGEKLGRNPPTKELTIIDDYTIEYTFKNKNRLLPIMRPVKGPRYHHEKSKPWLEAMQDATSQKEVRQTGEELDDVTVRPTETDEIVSNGLWKIESANDQEVMLTLHEGHPNADVQNIENIRLTLTGGQDARRQRVQNDLADQSDAVAPNTNLPDHWDSSKAPDNEGLNTRYDYTNPHLGKHGVRQAIAFLLSPENMARSAPDPKFPTTYQTGMQKLGNQKNLSEEFKNTLIQYGSTSKPGKAESRMQAAGYSKSGGKWRDSEGNAISFNMVGLNWAAEPLRTASSSLKAFGFETSIETKTTSGTWNLGGASDWDIELGLGLGGPNLHPIEYYRMQPYSHRLRPYWKEADEEGGGYLGTNLNYVNPDEDDDPADLSGYCGRPVSAEIPAEVGKMDLSGETRTVNIIEKRRAITDPTTPDEEFQQAVEDLAWRCNFLADPFSPYSFANTNYGDTRDFSWPNLNNEKVGLGLGSHAPIKYALEQGLAFGTEK